MKKLLPITRFGRIRTTDEIATVRDGKTVITHPRTLVEVEADNGVVVGIVDLADLLGDMSRRLAGFADMSDRLAAVEALVKVKSGDTPEVEKLKAQIRPVVEGRKKGTEKSAKVRKQNQEDWIAYAKQRIRDMREREPTLNKREAVDRLTDENEDWPPDVRRPGRSTLEKAMPTLWVEGQITRHKRK
jgi:hypothetical protein